MSTSTTGSYGSLLLLPHHQESLSVRLRLEGPRRQPPHEEEETDVQPGHATLLSCILNLVNTVVGAGMLGLPGALGGTGYLTGCILMAASATFSAHGLYLLTQSAQSAGLPSSFYSVARAAVPEYTVLIDSAVAMKCFGVATGYLITVGDCMVDALHHLLLTGNDMPSYTDTHHHPWWISVVVSRQFWIIGALVSVVPISFFRTLDALKTASAVAMLFVIFLVVGIIAYANGWADPCLDIQPAEICVGDIEPYTTIPRTLSKLPIFIFSFTCHQNIFPVVNEIRNRSQTKLNVAVIVSIGLALILFATVALEGYATFGSNVLGDVLLNYPKTPHVTMLRIFIAIMVALSYPLQLDPSRRCITSLYKVVQQWRQRGYLTRVFHRLESSTGLTDNERSALRPSSSNITAESGHPPAASTTNNGKDEFMSDNAFYVITIAFLLLSFTVAMIVDDLGVVLAMVGATGSTLVSYILPGLIYIKIHPTVDVSHVLALVQLLVGCLIMPVALYFVLSGSVQH